MVILYENSVYIPQTDVCFGNCLKNLASPDNCTRYFRCESKIFKIIGQKVLFSYTAELDLPGSFKPWPFRSGEAE